MLQVPPPVTVRAAPESEQPVAVPPDFAKEIAPVPAPPVVVNVNDTPTMP